MVSHLYIYISLLQGEPAQFQQNVLPNNLYIMILYICTHQTSKETSSNNGDAQFTSPNSVVSLHTRTKPKSHTCARAHKLLNEGKLWTDKWEVKDLQLELNLCEFLHILHQMVPSDKVN